MSLHIKLTEAHDILSTCKACIIDHSMPCIPAHNPLTNDSENEFLSTEYYDIVRDRKVNVSFVEGNNQKVPVVGNTMYFLDSEGETWTIMPLYDVDVKKKAGK